MAQALGKATTFAKCLSQRLSAKEEAFAECHDPGTRQSRHHRGARHHGDFSLRSAWLARGKGFAECLTKNTQQRSLCR